MEPAFKSPTIRKFLNSLIEADMEECIKQNLCIPRPIGCGRDIPQTEIETWNKLTQREYTISGLCNNCQDKVFE